MEAVIFLSIIIALFSILVSCFAIRRVKKQIAEITDALIDVTNGNGTDAIGQRAYIVIPKEVLSQISENGYATFLENKIKNSGYNWFSIICDDGTGIVFSNSFTGLGTYGELDDEGCVTTPLGYISASESGYEYELAN